MHRPARLSRTTRLVRRLLSRNNPKPVNSGLRLVRGVPLVAAIDKDRVVREELRTGRISLDAVRTAWYHVRDYQDERPLWRVLADVQSVDAGPLFRAAARIYHFDEAMVSMLGTAILIDGNWRHLSDSSRQKMLNLGVFPIREKNDPLDYGVRWTFASYDPARPEVRQLLSSSLSQAFQLRFLEPTVLFDVIEACVDIENVESIMWHRRYVLGKKPINLVVKSDPRPDEIRRAA